MHLNAFKEYKARVEKQTGKIIKKLRSDNAKEYLSKEFTQFLNGRYKETTYGKIFTSAEWRS